MTSRKPGGEGQASYDDLEHACKRVEDQAVIQDTAESLHRLGYQELIVLSDKDPAVQLLHGLHQHTVLRLQTWWRMPADK